MHSIGQNWLMPGQRTQAITNADAISEACSWSDLKAVFRWQAALAFGMQRRRRPGRRALELWLAEAAITEDPVFRAVRENGRVQAQALAAEFVAWPIKWATRHARLRPSRVTA